MIDFLFLFRTRKKNTFAYVIAINFLQYFILLHFHLKNQMKSLRTKSKNERIYTQVAQEIGQAIRNQLISSKRQLSEKKVLIPEFFAKRKTSNDPEKTFWLNPYQTQKSKWNFSHPKFFISTKEDIDNSKKYELQKFKQKLKSKMLQRQQTKQHQLRISNSRVKEFRSHISESLQQKIQNSIQQKQFEAEIVRRNLYKTKMEARIFKRQKVLQIEFNKWHRQQEKLLKHQSKVTGRDRLKTTVN